MHAAKSSRSPKWSWRSSSRTKKQRGGNVIKCSQDASDELFCLAHIALRNWWWWNKMWTAVNWCRTAMTGTQVDKKTAESATSTVPMHLTLRSGCVSSISLMKCFGGHPSMQSKKFNNFFLQEDVDHMRCDLLQLEGSESFNAHSGLSNSLTKRNKSIMTKNWEQASTNTKKQKQRKRTENRSKKFANQIHVGFNEMATEEQPLQSKKSDHQERALILGWWLQNPKSQTSTIVSSLCKHRHSQQHGARKTELITMIDARFSLARWSDRMLCVGESFAQIFKVQGDVQCSVLTSAAHASNGAVIACLFAGIGAVLFDGEERHVQPWQKSESEKPGCINVWQKRQQLQYSGIEQLHKQQPVFHIVLSQHGSDFVFHCPTQLLRDGSRFVPPLSVPLCCKIVLSWNDLTFSSILFRKSWFVPYLFSTSSLAC